jgi:hypothetical protein
MGLESEEPEVHAVMISKELEYGKPIVILVSINAAVGALWDPYVPVLVNIAPHREKETRLPMAKYVNCLCTLGQRRKGLFLFLIPRFD